MPLSNNLLWSLCKAWNPFTVGHTHTNIHTHAQLTQTHAHTFTDTYTHRYTHTHIHTRPQKHSHIPTPTNKHTYTHTVHPEVMFPSHSHHRKSSWQKQAEIKASFPPHRTNRTDKGSSPGGPPGHVPKWDFWFVFIKPGMSYTHVPLGMCTLGSFSWCRML